MGISQHILDHTLRNMFDNKYAVYARAIGVNPHDLGVAIQSVRDGGKSATMLDATLELYARDRLAWDVLLLDYLPEPGSRPQSLCWGAKIGTESRDKYLMCAAQLKRLDALCLYSIGMIDRTESACCGANCDHFVACAYYQKQGFVVKDMPVDCPCVLFDMFTDALLKYAAKAV